MTFPLWLAGQKVTAGELNEREVLTVTQQAEQTVTNNETLQNATDLVFWAKANVEYRVMAVIVYGGTTATTGGRDAKFAWTVPTGATMRRRNTVYEISAIAGALSDGRGRPILLRQRAATTEQGAGCTGTDGFANYIEDCQLVMGATAGYVQFQFAQLVAAPGTQVTLRAESCLYVQRVR